MVYAAFAKDIQNTYNSLRSDKLTFQSIMRVLYDQQIALISPAHYNADAAFTYLDYPSYYYTAQGSRYERLKYWVENRFAYLDSKLENKLYRDDSFELRCNATLPIKATPDITMFLGIKFGQDVEVINKKRCEANQEVSFDPRDYGISNMNDLETLIYGASHIKSLGDLSDHQVTSIKFPATGESVLENIIIGSEEENYLNTNFTTLEIGKNNLLKTVNVSNCINLGKESTTLDLSKCPSIQQVYAKNTKLTNIKLAEGTPIQILHLPYGVQNVELVNQIKLSDLTIEGYSNIETLVWDNVPKSLLTVESILNSIYESGEDKLSNVRLIGFNPSASVTTSWANWIFKKQGINDTGASTTVPYITGVLPIKTIDTSLLKPYVKAIAENLGDNFAYVRTLNLETNINTYYRYDKIDDVYIEISEDDLSQYKLQIFLDQIVADENIFGVTGEGE